MNKQPHHRISQEHSIFQILFQAFACWSVSVAAGPLPAQTTPERESPLIRELYVPFDDLKVVLGNDTERVFMTRDEFEALKASAQVEKRAEIPLDIVLLETHYEANLGDGRAWINGELKIEVLSEGLHALALPFSVGAIRSASLDGEPAKLTRNAAGQILVFAQGIGLHSLSVRLLVPVQTDSAQQTLNLQLATASSASLRLRVLGNVEIKSGATVVERSVDQQGSATSFQLVPSADSMTIVMSLNNRQLRDRSTIMVRGVLLSEITAGYERLHATMSMAIANGANDEFRFLIDERFAVNEVTCDGLSRWEIEQTGSGSELVVKLRQPATDLTVVKTRLDRKQPALDHWTLPTLTPLNVQGYSAVIGLLIEDRIQVESIEPRQLLPIDSRILASALPQNMSAEVGSGPSIVPKAAFYAVSEQHGLAAEFELLSGGLAVKSNMLISASDQGLEAEGGFSLVPKHDALHSFAFRSPAGWRVTAVRLADESPLRFDAYQEQAGSRIQVEFPHGVKPDSEQVVLFQARYVPPSWIGTWAQQSVDLPTFTVLGADAQEGAVALQTKDDLTASPSFTTNLIALTEQEKDEYQLGGISTSHIYRFLTPNWSANFNFVREKPRITARVFSFFRVNPNTLDTHGEVMFFVRNARTDELLFSLPESTPAEVNIRGLDGIQIKESTSSVADARRNWRVQLAERRAGAIRLAVDLTQPLTEADYANLTLPCLRAEGVDYQSGAMTIEGHSELDVALNETPRPIDVGETVDADYQVGKRLLGVFGYVGNADRAVVSLSLRQVFSLPTTLVELASMTTRVSQSGIQQTSAEYRLKTKASYLAIQLPADAVLWSVSVDGQPALPQHEVDSVLLALPANTAAASRTLQIVYETSHARAMDLRSEFSVTAPELFERVSRDVIGEKIPVADLRWQVILPSGYRLIAANGLRTEQGSLWEGFLKALWKVGGGRTGPFVRLGARRRSTTEAIKNEAVSERPPQPSFGQPAGPAPGQPERARSRTTTEAIRNEAVSERPPQPSFGQPAGPGLGQPESLRSRSDTEGLLVPETAERDFSVNGAVLQQLEAGVEATGAVQVPAEKGFQAQSGQASKEENGDGGVDWTLQGLRSLEVKITSQPSVSEQKVELLGLGAQSSIRLAVVDQQRTVWIAFGLSLLVFVIGLTRKTWPARISYLILVAVLGGLIPTWGDWFPEPETVENYLITSELLLLVIYLLHAVFPGLSGSRKSRLNTVPAARTGTKSTVSPITGVLVLAASLGSFDARAQEQASAPTGEGSVLLKTIDQVSQLQEMLQALGGEGNVTIPPDAVVIPYDPEAAPTIPTVDKLLVPLATYEKLRDLAEHRNQALTEKPPVDFAWAGASYTAKIDGSASLIMDGKFNLQQFVKHDIAIPISMSGCVIESISVDSKPAKLQLVRSSSLKETQLGYPQQQAAMPSQVAEAPVPAPDLLLLVTSGVGTHEVVLRLRWKVETSGGWRSAEGQVPVAPASALNLVVEHPNTELRLSGFNDRAAYTTIEQNQTIEAALPFDGRISLRWRDKVSEAVIDQGLTVDSSAVFDIQEDALRLAWKGDFTFRRGRRESLSLLVPNDYLVEKVLGNNVRGWQSSPIDRAATDATQQRLDVELLKPATENESLTVLLSKRHSIFDEDESEIAYPKVSVPDSLRHAGQFTVRRSKVLDVRSLESVGLSRIDVPDRSAWLAALEKASPLPLETFQAYQFAQADFRLPLTGSLTKPSLNVEAQSLIKISQLGASLETRLLVTAVGRPVYKLLLRLPADLVLKSPQLEGQFEWSVLEDSTLSVGDDQIVEIYLADGKIGQFPVILNGDLGSAVVDRDQSREMALPSIAVINAEKQIGTFVVQSDPAYNVRSQDLLGCEVNLLSIADRWLSPKQRELAQLAVTYSTAVYSGRLVISPRRPIVKTFATSNVKVTDRAVEETIYLEASISSAGIRDYVFQLPAYLASARIEAPLIRQKTITPVDENEGSPVRVRLDLQDAVTGQFAVIVTHDRLLQSQGQLVPIPLIETGETSERIITLENAGRDELLTSNTVSVERLERSQLAQRRETQDLIERSSFLYRVNEEQATTAPPSLTYESNTRTAVVTAEARIGLARTSLVLDDSGAYRAMVEYRVENRTEPFLEITLPDNAKLWTVQVAGEPVKPTVATSAGSVRIPLIKTAEGDLDYAVIVKYGGVIPEPGWLTRTEFPLAKTENLKVELSQVKLWLPENYRWFQFDGTLGKVRSESDLQAGWLSFRTKQISELTDLLNTSGKMYSQMRAQNNLKQLSAAIQQENYRFARPSQELERVLQENTTALQRAENQINEFQSNAVTSEAVRGNRDALELLYNSQTNYRSNQVVDELGSNFPGGSKQSAEASQPAKPLSASASYFDDVWFENNRLGKRPDLAEAAGKKEVADQKESKASGLNQLVPQLGKRVEQSEKDSSLEEQSLGRQQILGDYKQQANKYNELLLKNSADSESLRRGEREFGLALEGEQTAPEAATRALSMSKGGQIVDPSFDQGRAAGRQAAPQSGFGAYGGGEATSDTNADMAAGVLDFRGGTALALQQSSGPATFNQPQAGEDIAGMTPYLASLDVELPLRGTEFMFSTPGGELELSSQSIAADFIDRLIATAAILALAAAVAVLFRILTTIFTQRFWRSMFSIGLAIFGVLSLLIGLMPLYGLLALLSTAAIWLAHRESSQP